MSCRTPLPGLLLIALGFFASAQPAVAQPFVWNRNANDSWNIAGNWNPTGIPNGQGVGVVFGNVITANREVTLNSPVTVGGITIQDTAFTYTIFGGSILTLDNGASPAVVTMAANVGAHQRVNPTITALSDITAVNHNTSWRLFFEGGINLGTHTFSTTGAGIVTIGSSAGITGSNGLIVQNGTGELRLTAPNTGVKYVINNGTMAIGTSSNVLSTPSFTADLVTINNNAILRFEHSQSSTNIGITLGTGGGRIEVLTDTTAMFSGVISGSTALTKVGTGKLIVTGANTYTGDTIIRDGTIRLESNVAPGVAGPLGNSTAPILVGDNLGANNTGLLAGGTSAVTVSRDITVVASAAPGASTVSIGSEATSASAAFTGTLTLNRNVTLTTSSFNPTVSFGRITGTGGVTVAGGGVVTFTSAVSDFTGTITIGAGTLPNPVQGALAISADAQLGAASNALFFYGGRLIVTGSTPLSTSRALTLGYINGVQASGIIDVQNTDATSGFTINSPITGAGPFRKTGPGILTLSAANTHGYTTFVEQGTLRVTGANFLSPNSILSVTTGATIQLNGFNQQVPALKNPASLNPGIIHLGANPSMVLTLGTQGQFGPFIDPPVFTGSITGTGNLVKTGRDEQQLGAAAVGFTGMTTVQQGVLEFTTGVAAGAGMELRLGDPSFSAFDTVLFGSKTGSMARPFTVVAGTGTRTIGHQLSGTTHNGSTVTFSAPITLEKDLQLYSKTDFNNQGSVLQLSGAIGGSGGLVKIGGGPVSLTGDNTYTGATTILKGQLIIGGAGQARSSSRFFAQIDYNATIGPSFNPLNYLDGNVEAELAIHDFSPNPDRIGDVDVTLSHGKFTYWGQSAGASSESFRNLVIDRGPNTLVMNTANNASITSAAISMTGGLVRNAGGGTLLVVSQNTLGNPDGGDYTRVLAATPPALLGGGGAAGSTNISIIPWAFHDTDPNGALAITTESFLTYGPTGLRPLVDSEYVTSLTAAGTLNNVRLITASNSLNADQSINSLRYGLSTAGTITLNNNAKLTINSGAILSTSSQSLTITGGEIAFGASEGIIHTSFSGNVVINSVISGTGGLTSNVKSGSLVLNGANTYTGPTTINSGGITFNSAASFGAGGDPIRNRNGTGGGITYSGAGLATLPNPIEIGTYSTGIGVSSAGTLRLTGVISGTSGITSTLAGSAVTFAAGSGTIELRAANTFTGSVMLTSGTLGVVANNNFGAAQNELYMGTINNPTLRFDAADVDLGRTIVVGGTLTLNSNGFNAAISGSLIGGEPTRIVTKAGAGILTLTGVSTTQATLDVAGGTLRVNGSIALPFGGGVNVNNGGTLGGSGSIERVVTVNTGGTLAPGSGVGSLTVRTLAFGSSANAAYDWEAGAGSQDQIVVTTGPLNLTGVNVTLNLFDRGLGFGVNPSQQFPLITVAGTGSIAGFNPANFNVVFADTPNWSTSQYSLNLVELGGNSVVMLSNITPVPEPVGVLALSGAALALSAWRRRRGR